MLGVIVKCIKTTSNIHVAAPLVCLARAGLGPAKCYASTAGDASGPQGSFQDLMRREVPVDVVEFEISASEAVRRFDEYQRKKCKYLHAHNLLKQTSSESGNADGSNAEGLTPAFLPFWCFNTSFSSEARGKLGFKDTGTGEMVWKNMTEPLSLSTRATASYDDMTMQVYGSYKYVRDVGCGAAGPGLPSRARPLTLAEAQAGAVGGAVLHAASMRQGLAWQLALRALTHHQLQQAEGAVRSASGAADVKDVHVSLQVHSRSCRLVLLPAYIAVYKYGSRYKQGTSGVILPQVFIATIGGTREGRVVAPQHLSPAKASLGLGGLVGSLGLLASDLASWGPPLLGLEALAAPLGPVEALMLAALAASGAGMWAQQRPQKLRAHQLAQQVRADLQFYKEYDMRETYGSAAAAAAAGAGGPEPQHAGGGGSGSNEEYMLWLWSDADWRRWEHDEPWNWDEQERKTWAEELWRRQAVRRLERQRYLARMVAEARRREADEQAEMRRERMYGSGSSSRYSRHRPLDHGIGGDGGGGEGEGQESYSAHQRRRRRRLDFLGFYRALGLQEAEAVSTEDIKQAFKTQALLLHPDKHVSADKETQQTALVKFQKLQIAYDILKDEEKRRLYDRGQLMQ